MNRANIRSNVQMLLGGIYEIKLSDTHYYGGRSRDVKSRGQQHLNDLKSGCHRNKHMQAVFNQHQRFEIHHLIPLDSIEDMKVFEQYWLDANVGWSGCVNISPKSEGGGALKGCKLSAEHRAKISSSSRGKSKSEDHRTNLRSSLKGHVLSPETKEKISAAHKGKQLSQPHKERLLEAITGRRVSDETRAKLSASLLGRSYSPETLSKMSVSQKGRVHTLETREKIGLAQRGKPKQRGVKGGSNEP